MVWNEIATNYLVTMLKFLAGSMVLLVTLGVILLRYIAIKVTIEEMWKRRKERRLEDKRRNCEEDD